MQESCLRALAPKHEEHGWSLGQSIWIRHAKISFIDGALVLGLDWQGELVIDPSGTRPDLCYDRDVCVLTQDAAASNVAQC